MNDSFQILHELQIFGQTTGSFLHNITSTGAYSMMSILKNYSFADEAFLKQYCLIKVLRYAVKNSMFHGSYKLSFRFYQIFATSYNNIKILY